VALEERTITIPDYESVDANDIKDALINELDETRNKIDSKIHELAQGNIGEIQRIRRSHQKMIYKWAVKDGLVHNMERFDEPFPDDKDPALMEGILSTASIQCDFCALALRDFDFVEAFKAFAYANEILGMADGCDRTEKLSDLKKESIQQYAAQIRHAENRMMKEEAIQYYKNNYASFSSKDDAAMHIAEKIVPAKFATVRGWLKGVNPE
jgi:hypothetical protein